MIDRLFSSLAPHLCCSCGEIGTLLCDHCKNDIVMTGSLYCIACGRGVSASGVCRQCHVPYVKAWFVGEHTESLRRLIQLYKFEYARAAAVSLGDILHATVSELPSTTIVVPVPTVAAHIRERGYDHIRLIAQHFSRLRDLKMVPLIARVGSEKQRGASRAQRITQAKRAFRVHGPVDAAVPYLLIDDVVTTGSTIQYAALALWQAGAREIWVAAIARQPID